MATLEELRVLARYSSPGLRKHELTRDAKAAHLTALGIKGLDRQKILETIYPEPSSMVLYDETMEIKR